MVVVASLLPAACSLAFQRPTLRVADVRLAALGVSGGTVAVLVNITNPNRYALESGDFRYTLSMPQGAEEDGGWLTLAEGRHESNVTVPPGDSATVEFQVPFEMAPIRTALGRLLGSGELEYRFTGELQVTSPRRMRVPFDRRGVFRPH